jgi:hypothetical protein
MTGLVIFLIVMAMLATGFVLVRGIVIMARGNDVSGVKQNKMMWYRVLFQGIAVALCALLLAMMSGN